MKYFRVFPLVVLTVCAVLLVPSAFAQANPEPAGWYAGDMHVHRSCGGAPEPISSVFSRMAPENLAVVSQLADSGNGEVQDPATDLPLVNGQDDPISTPSSILHWDAEWHWDAIYTQYPHQALGGHIVTLGLSKAQQLWQEYTFPILDWAHQQNGIAGFAHLQYLDGSGLPTTLTCCTPIEYPVEVALGSADFISEDVFDVNQPSGGPPGAPMYTETTIQAYYKLLNSGFRPGLAAGTDYPCNGADNGGALGSLLTYVQVAGGQLTYRNWIQGIANGRTVVSRNGHNEFLNLIVNGTAMPGDEVQMTNSGNVQVTVQWTADQNLSGTIELVQNGIVVASKQTTAAPGTPGTLTAAVNFGTSGWLAARRMSNGQHYVHTAAVFVIINNAPIRASAPDAQYFVNWTNGLLQNTSPGGVWNSFFQTSLNAAQARYQAANALYQQIASEAGGSGPTLSSLALSPGNQTIATGSQQSFAATGTYSNGTTLNVTGQVRWASSNSTVAVVSPRGLVSAISPGTTTISASLGKVTTSTTLTVQSSPLLITTQSLPSGTAGNSYSVALTATGGTLPYAWSIASSSLPAGLSLNVSTGAITGIPTAAGTFNFTVQVSDSGSPRQVATNQFTIVIAPSGGGGCPCTIWPSSTVPGTADSGPDSAVELGVTFRADIDGFISGVRFYKGVGNTGTHIGNLWSSIGTLLATATFSGETASGWQQVSFSSPVAVTANAVYVASYHTNVGHYSDDQLFFASTGVDNSPLHALADGASAANGVYNYGSSSSFPNLSWRSSNYWVDVVFTPASTTVPPAITAVTPAAGATGTSIGTTVRATFNHSMSASSITAATFLLSDSSGNPVPASVGYAAASSTATLTPSAELAPSTTYTATVAGGSNGVKDINGNTMVSDYTWSFTTGAVPPINGPGGPILVIANVLNPFSRYYSEILNAEGLNEYTVADIASVSSTMLSSYDVAILGEMALTSAQTTMLSNWVTGGGRLIAMRPDKQLAALLGLTPSNSTLSDAYLQVRPTGPGTGIEAQTIQFHGTADVYTLSGASTLATLYSNASSPTAAPAATLVSVGAGQAAAFTYDLARSIVYTRQGNPAWSGQARDGQSGPIRSDDLFFGAASFDPQSDWVDLNKVSIPQADEQQRFLANLVLQMELSNKPLPRFWYFPSGFKAVVVMTGDDHGSFYSGSATAQRFSDFVAASPTGCSVADWQCVRSTSYLFPQDLASNPLTNSQAAAYVAQGFEVSVHGDSVPSCSDWTTASLDSFYNNELTSFSSQFPSVPAPQTHRMHCISWTDYDSQPQVELKYGIRLDTSYYYWPPQWVNDQPGMFTGSGMPMRYSDRNGNIVNVYQAATQMTDESGQTFPFNIDTLLDNAIGTPGYYGVFVANMHNDQGSYPGPGANEIVASAQTRGVPVVSSQQMLTWLDGRNSSSFGSISWNGNILGFSITVGTGARNLQGMVPFSSTSGTLTALNLNGNTVPFSTQTIKGIQYAVFTAAAGSYQATYGGGSGTATLSTISVNPSSVPGGTASTGTVTLSGPAPTGGATVTLSTSNTAAAQTPPTVVVPSGNTNATFSITTSVVSATTNVTITGSFGTTQTTTLTVTAAPPSLTSLALNPTSVIGGSSSIGTVTLSAAAPTGGAVVTLTSNNIAAQVPPSVTVGAGVTTATFSVTTSAVPSNTFVSISGTYGVSQVAATLTVNAATLSTLSLIPASVVGGNNSTGTATLNGAAPTGGAIVSLQSSNTAAAQVIPSVTVPAGATSTTFVVTTSAVASNTSSVITGTFGGSQSATLTVTAPVSLSSLTLSPASVVGGNNSTGTVTLTGAAPTGGAVVTLQSNNTTAAQVPASVMIAAGTTSATFAITSTPVLANTSVVISGVYGVTRTATFTVNAATLSALTRSPTSVVGGNNSTGTVTLTGAAPTGGALVTLQSSNTTAAQVPASVSIAAGAMSATFTITTTPVVANTTVTISGTYGITQTNTLTVTAATLSSVTRSPTSVVGGNNSTGTVTLNGAAPAGGAVVILQSSNISAASVPANVNIPAGSRSASFTITTSGVASSTSVTISAVYGLTRTTTLTVSVASLTSLTLNPSTVIGGSSSTGTLTLNGAAPPSGAVISLTSSRTSAAQVPPSATIPAGTNSITFTVTTSSVHGTSSSISGTYRSTTRSARLTVQ